MYLLSIIENTIRIDIKTMSDLVFQIYEIDVDRDREKSM